MDIKATPYSNLKIFAHADKLRDIKVDKRSAPIYIRIKPTNYCNHKCYYCSYADKELGLRNYIDKQDQIPQEKMQNIVSDIHDIGVKAVTFSGGGEPLIYPYIIETMQNVLDFGIDLSIITNGQLLDNERAKILAKAKWVRISFDSAKADTYSKIRNIDKGSFDKVCKNIENFSNIKSQDCELGINFVINHENYDQVYAVSELVKKLGVNHIKFTARITKDLYEYHQKFKDISIKQIHDAQDKLEDNKFKVINKYEDDFEYAMVFNRCYNKCYIKEFVTVIAADCKVYFCHDKAYVETGVVGDLMKQSFKELWYSDDVVNRYKLFDASKECKHHCVYDERNQLLNSFFSLNENHINFI